MLSIFIINLKKDVKKKEHIKKLCVKYNLFPKFIEAVDGTLLDHNIINKISSKEKSINSIGRKLSCGEIGCALSHKKIYEKIIDENLEYALILEDDINFNDDLLKSLNLIDKLPLDWELFLLGHHAGSSREKSTAFNLWYKKQLNDNFILRKPCEPAYGTYGYCITYNGAKKLLKCLTEIFLPIDHYTGNSQYINLYIIQTPVIFIHTELTKMSNVNTDREQLEQAFLSLQNNKPDSWKKKIAKKIGLYEFLILTYYFLISLVQKIRPLRKYQ